VKVLTLNRRTVHAAVVLLVFSIARASAWQTVKTDELPPDTLIVLQRGACEHRCAVYKIVIFADGSVIYDGLSYVRRPGLVKSNISLEALGNLLREAQAAHFFELKARYGYGATDGCDSIRSDAPAVTLSIATGGQSKVILHHLRCVSAESDRLKQLEDSIDSSVNSARWIK
jgi:hypothetical protein